MLNLKFSILYKSRVTKDNQKITKREAKLGNMFANHSYALDHETHGDFSIFTLAYRDKFIVEQKENETNKVECSEAERLEVKRLEERLEERSQSELFKDLLGANGYIAATKDLHYVDGDFLTMYHILKTHIRVSKRLYNVFYFGCDSNQHHLATYIFMDDKVFKEPDSTKNETKKQETKKQETDFKKSKAASYIAYGADIKLTSGSVFGGAKPIRAMQGFDKTGDLLSIGTIKSISNSLDEDLVGDIWMYVCDINPVTKTHLYNQLVLAMRVERDGWIILRLPNVWDIHVYVFILFCIELFTDLEMFRAPWNNNLYLICKSCANKKYYASYIKFLQQSKQNEDYMLLSNQFISEREDVIADINVGLLKIRAAKVDGDVNEYFVEL